MPKSQKHPVTAPQAVTTERLTDEIGLLRVAMFPGAIGIDVARDIDRGIAALDGCNRIIVDLRGNTGGGIGGLRLMSYLTPGKLEVGWAAAVEAIAKRGDPALLANTVPAMSDKKDIVRYSAAAAVLRLSRITQENGTQSH
jgi:carboxyl-terminal processing protease